MKKKKLKKKDSKNFDFNAYMHKIMDAIEESYWVNDSEFTINITNSHVLSNHSVKDAVIAAVIRVVSISVPITLELSGVSGERNNQLKFQINDMGKAKKRILFDMFRNPNFKNLPSTIYYKIDWDMKYLVIIKGDGEIFAEVTNIEPNEEQEVLDFTYNLIKKGFKLYGRYDLLKLEYEQTGSICNNHNITVCTF